MSTTEPLTTVIADAALPQSVLTPEELPGKRKLGLGAWLSIGWLAIVTLSAILAPILPIPDPNKINTNIVREGPFHGSFSVVTQRPRRVLTVHLGARVSLLVGISAILFALDHRRRSRSARGLLPARPTPCSTSSFDILLAPRPRPRAHADRGAVAEQPHPPAHDSSDSER
jgi:hypothetical protein